MRLTSRNPVTGAKETHWWVEGAGLRIDPTFDQFPDGPPSYGTGTAAGFLTREPSRRARVLMEKAKRVLAARGLGADGSPLRAGSGSE